MDDLRCCASKAASISRALFYGFRPCDSQISSSTRTGSAPPRKAIRQGESHVGGVAAGFSSGQVSNIRCYLERDDGRWEYTVEFWQGTMEYEFEIDAYSGTILSRDVDSIYD